MALWELSEKKKEEKQRMWQMVRRQREGPVFSPQPGLTRAISIISTIPWLAALGNSIHGTESEACVSWVVSVSRPETHPADVRVASTDDITEPRAGGRSTGPARLGLRVTEPRASGYFKSHPARDVRDQECSDFPSPLVPAPASAKDGGWEETFHAKNSNGDPP